MKKVLSFVPFIIACCLLIGAIGWGVFGFCDTYREVEQLKELPGVSGVDYLSVYFAAIFLSIGVFLASVCGMILSGISARVVKNEKLRTASGVLMVLFGLLLILSMVMCILGMR